jgi:hypothetical protein
MDEKPYPGPAWMDRYVTVLEYPDRSKGILLEIGDIYSKNGLFGTVVDISHNLNTSTYRVARTYTIDTAILDEYINGVDL